MTAEADREPFVESRSRHRRTLAVVVIVFAAVAIGLLAGRAIAPTTATSPAVPAEGSTEAGFARDMAEHHAQAVEMATMLNERTVDADLQYLTKDIALTQQAQIGRMSGWLEEWGLPAARTGPAMAWMKGHHGDGDGAMPGMASRDDIARLQSLPVADAEILFLQLMIRHHRGGIDMAQGALDGAERPSVRALAEGIIQAQESEITAMSDLLRSRGAAVPA